MNEMPAPLPTADEFTLDDRIRGVPPGTTAFPASAVSRRNWRPIDGVMALPVLTLDEAAFAHNRDLVLRYVRARGVEIAPHAKTPMSPDLARSLIDAGAWGATVADCRQASILLRAGVKRLILANEVGGLGGARRFAALASAWPDAEIYVFVDSVAAIEALATAWRADLPLLRVLIEVGAGRAGVRSLADAETLFAAAAANTAVAIEGVATYEGAAAQTTAEATNAAVDSLLDLTASALSRLRAVAAPEKRLMVSAGGSAFFDRVVDKLQPALDSDGEAFLVLRSGAIFFHDHGVYDRALSAMDERRGFSIAGAASAGQSFRPALRVWAEILSRPEPTLAICGMGMRDVSFDQGLPVVLGVYRGGEVVEPSPGGQVVKLNDQHAFLALEPDADFQIGDIVEFGVSHPCTCLDRYRVIFGLDENGRVRKAYQTYFG